MKLDVDKTKLGLGNDVMLQKLNAAWNLHDSKSYTVMKELAIEYDFTGGSWMLLFSSEEIDDVWEKLRFALNEGKVKAQAPLFVFCR